MATNIVTTKSMSGRSFTKKDMMEFIEAMGDYDTINVSVIKDDRQGSDSYNLRYSMNSVKPKARD